MPRSWVTKSFQLLPAQADKLRILSYLTGVPEAALARQALDQMFREPINAGQIANAGNIPPAVKRGPRPVDPLELVRGIIRRKVSFPGAYLCLDGSTATLWLSRENRAQYLDRWQVSKDQAAKLLRSDVIDERDGVEIDGDENF